MNIKQKLEKKIGSLQSASFNGFADVLQDFWSFFNEEPALRQVGENLRIEFPDMADKVRIFFSSKTLIKTNSVKESVALSFEVLQKLSIMALDNRFRGGLMAAVYPKEFSVYDFGNQPAIDSNYLITFKEKYLEKFCHYVEEQLDDEMQDKIHYSQTNHYHSTVGAVQNGNNNTANVNQNIGQNFSEILEQLAILKNQFQSLPQEDREEAIEIVDLLAVEVQSENPSKGKVKAFLSSVKDFAVKTGTDVTSKIVVELVKNQIGIS